MTILVIHNSLNLFVSFISQWNDQTVFACVCMNWIDCELICVLVMVLVSSSCVRAKLCTCDGIYLVKMKWRRKKKQFFLFKNEDAYIFMYTNRMYFNNEHLHCWCSHDNHAIMFYCVHFKESIYWIKKLFVYK